MGAYRERKLRQNKKKRNVEIFGITLSSVMALLFVLMCIPLGKFSGFFLGVFGVGIYPLCVLFCLFGVGVFLSQRYYLQKRYFVYLVLNFVFLICLLHVAIGSKGLAGAKIGEFGEYLKCCYNRKPLTAGGVIVGVVTYPLVALMGVVGTCIVMAILLCIFVGLAVDFMFFRKNKLSKKDKQKDIRIIDENSDAGMDLSSLSHDFDTRATKLVPKKFEKEDNERYLGMQTDAQSAEYFSNRLQGIDMASRNEYVEPKIEKAEVVDQDSFVEQPVETAVETQNMTSEEEMRYRAKNLLFGKKENIQEERKAMRSASEEEIYPSRYDPNIFSSKREYITTPILPDFLNRKEIDRQTVLERNRKLMEEREQQNKIAQTREPVMPAPNQSFAQPARPMRDTSFLRATELVEPSQNTFSQVEERRETVQPNFESREQVSMPEFRRQEPAQPTFDHRTEHVASFDPREPLERPVFESQKPQNVSSQVENVNNVFEQPVRPNLEVRERQDMRSSNLDLTRQPIADNSQLRANEMTQSQQSQRPASSNSFLDMLAKNNRQQDNFEMSAGDEPSRPIRGVRGPDLAPRKTPDRSGVQPRYSDLVEEDKPSLAEFEQKRLGAEASVVAPAPAFLDRATRPQPIQESLLGEQKPSFGKPAKPVDAKYVAPNPMLLTTKSDDPTKYGGDTQAKSKVLEETLESFRIGAKVSNVVKGPSVTRYELQIPAGIPVRKIANYESNIAMTLMSKNGIRLELPIPGKNAVGVEIPNDAPCTVGLRDMVLSPEFQSASGALPVAIGKNISGEYVVKSMAKMVHLLVAGSTGSGKSVFLHNLILSLMFKSSPDQLRFIMIDPKRVEFVVYNGMPHMMLPNVVTECDKAINALSWATKEMDRRYRMFNQHLVNDIETFNKCPEVQSGEEKKIPYIVIVIDELADLMMIGQKEVERHIQRIAQLGRACGIHLVIATQRPTVQVVTGTIKANLPTRVAFSLTSVIDSKTILDEGGAEKLIGKGDMLFSPQGASQPIRLQAAYASLEEVKAIVGFLKENNACYYDEEVEKEIMAVPEENVEDVQASGGSGDSVDEFFYPALRLFIETGTASTTMIQRRFGVGYARAARLVDQMEVKGYVSPQNGSKKRNVYITMEQYRELSGDED